jgi:uncharacterized ferritin-like protein (DUF455 family)
LNQYELSEKILLGSSLSEKLSFSTSLSWAQDRPCKPSLPARPSRGFGLAFGQISHSFPKENLFADRKIRAQALHYFANHELLAIELFAWAILRFDEIDEVQTRVLIRTIGDEQKHLRMYITRIEELGGAFGDYPLNDYLWSELTQSRSFEAFSAAMALTFEQANLDHALYFQSVFAKVGDSRTAEILNVVYRDEIKHVAAGTKTLLSSRNRGGSSLWDFYVKLLPGSLSPARAKGKVFSEDSRRKAGLPDDFVSQLRLFNRSKGRPPDAWILNIGNERRLGMDGAKDTQYQQLAQTLSSDLAPMISLMARRDDLVIIQKPLSLKFRQRMQNSGMPRVEFYGLWNNGDHERKIQSFKYWAPADDLGQKWAKHSAFSSTVPSQVEKTLMQELVSKQYGLSMLETLSPAKFPAFDIDSRDTWRHLRDTQLRDGNGDFVIKDRFGSSGHRHLVFNFNNEGSLAHAEKHIQGSLKRNMTLVMERWDQREIDFSIHGEIDGRGKSNCLGLTVFKADQKGVYQGTVLGGESRSRLNKFIVQQGISPSDFREEWRSAYEMVTKNLLQKGFEGAFSLDCYLYWDKTKGRKILSLRPLVEVNPRVTMGRISLEIEKLIHRRSTGVFVVVNRRQMSEMGFSNFSEMEEFIDLKIRAVTSENDKIKSGLLPLSDAVSVEAFYAFALVGHTTEELVSVLPWLATVIPEYLGST